VARRTSKALFAALALILLPGTSFAADLLKLAIGQRGLWDSAIAEIGTGAGIFHKHSLDLQVVYTSGGGETQQAVISGSVDIGVSPGMLGVLSIYAKGAPVRVIAGEATGTAEYYFVKADSPVQKDFKGVTPTMTLAYSTNGSGTHITALRFMKDYGFQAKLVATGSVANDLESVRTQTVRVTIANANDLGRRREVYDRFLRAYREVIDFMYADAKAIEAFAKYAGISTTLAQTVRDRFYPKAMLQLDEVKGLDAMMQDAIAFKYLTQPLTPQQVGELLQLPSRRR
jgi:NitT/TauT family transport system substrate-binding protein